MHTASTSFDTPLGRYVLAVRAAGVTHFQPAGSPKLPAPDAGADGALGRALASARAAFEAFFAGDCGALGGLALAPGGTAFQQRVWRALCEIPPGETASYGEVARRIDRPGAARAVGTANHHNPIAVAIPCHRVVGTDGQLVGYAGGVGRKRWLLEHERAWRERVYAASPKSKVPSARPSRAQARRRASAATSI